MAMDTELHALLRSPHIWKMETVAAGNMQALSTGFAWLDAQLPGGGWPRAALSEILVDAPGRGELTLLMPVMAAFSRHDSADQAQWLMWVAPPHIPYAPALVKHGVDLSRVLLVHAGGRQHRDILWAIEQALRSGQCAMVLAWIKSADPTALRRLQLAAEAGGSLAFLFRSAAAVKENSPARLRLYLGRGGEIGILKSRGGRPGRIRGASLPLQFADDAADDSVPHVPHAQ
jgi:hypothetical protein